MPVFGEAPVLIAVLDGADKTLEVLLLAKNQTGGINLTVDRRRLRTGGEASAQDHDEQERKKRKVTEMFFHNQDSAGEIG